MNLRFVEAFYWVVTLRSITRAAEKLHLTQSAMSSRIAALEQELGTALLDRNEKRFRITTAGARLFGYAEKLLTLQRELKVEIGSTQERALSLRLGAIESVLHSWLIGWIRHMRKEQHGLELELTVETTPLLLDQVQRGALDMVFAALPASGDGLRSRALPAIEMVFVGHRERHRRRRYTLADLSQHELLTFQRGSQPHMALLDQFRRAGVELPRVHAISSISAMVELVAGGLGIATLPRAAVERLGERLPLKTLACATPPAPLPVHLSWRHDPGSGVTAGVIDAVLAYASSERRTPRRKAPV